MTGFEINDEVAVMAFAKHMCTLCSIHCRSWPEVDGADGGLQGTGNAEMSHFRCTVSMGSLHGSAMIICVPALLGNAHVNTQTLREYALEALLLCLRQTVQHQHTAGERPAR